MPAPRRDLPPGHDWIDEHPPGRPAARHFSADFLADLLADLGVPAVAYLGRATDAEAAAFEARGLDVHNLGPERGRPALLGALDRLLAVSRAVGGPVAVYDGDEAAAGDDAVRTLATAWLMTACGFEAGEAGAWLGMACPGLG